MKITLIGSGNVATHFARAFFSAGHAIRQVFSRNMSNAQVFAAQVDAEAVNDFRRVSQGSDIYIFAIPDDALYDLPSDMNFGKSLCVHTSGSVPMDVLKNLSENFGVLYSPQTFVKFMDMQYAQVPFCLEASSAAVYDTLVGLVKTVSSKIYPLDSTQRRNLHLSAVFVNNFGNAMNAIAQEIAEKNRIPFEILFPLVDGTAQKAKLGNLWALQTGPAVRGDRQTMNSHVRLLAGNPQLQELYTLITDIIQQKTSGK